MTRSPTRIAAGVVLREPQLVKERCPWCFGAGLVAENNTKPTFTPFITWYKRVKLEQNLDRPMAFANALGYNEALELEYRNEIEHMCFEAWTAGVNHASRAPSTENEA